MLPVPPCNWQDTEKLSELLLPVDIELVLWEPQLLLVLGANHGGVRSLHLNKIGTRKGFPRVCTIPLGMVLLEITTRVLSDSY